MNWLPIMLAFHVFGVILWIGGVLGAGAVLLLHKRTPSGGDAFALAEDRLFKKLGGWGMMIAVFFGVAVVMSRPDFYMHQGWFHAKLTFVVLLIAAHMILRVQSRKIRTDAGAVSAGLLQGLTAGVAACALIIVLLVLTQPF